MTQLPWHWSIMKKVLHKHLLLFSLLIMMGSVGTIIGVCGLMFGDLTTQIIATIFALIPGLFILGFNVTSNYSSCLYYYEQALLKKYGKSVTATVTNKTVDRIVEKDKTSSAPDLDTLSIEYQFTYLRKAYEGASPIYSQDLFDAIEIGMEVPVITMKDHHHITRLQSIKLKRQLNLTKKKATDTTSQSEVGQSMMDD